MLPFPVSCNTVASVARLLGAELVVIEFNLLGSRQLGTCLLWERPYLGINTWQQKRKGRKIPPSLLPSSPPPFQEAGGS